MSAKVVLIDHPQMASYRFPGAHPLRPERFTLAVELMRSWCLLSESPEMPPGPQLTLAKEAEKSAERTHDVASVVAPTEATAEELELIHDPAYVSAVKSAGDGASSGLLARYGIGAGDTPPFPRMHEAAALVAGGTRTALASVLDGTATRAHNPAGGLHHAHRDHASGFCIYNDAAVAIQHAALQDPGLRIAYVDIDAHHGDGVQAAFWDRADVLTISVHESGDYLFPGSGRIVDAGEGVGLGYSLNVPLLPHCGPESFEIAMEQVVRPALRRFRPDVIVAQMGADSHRNDPLTHLHGSVRGFDATVASIVDAADELCDGRLVALGGGGYDTYSAVPRMWACVMCRLLGRAPSEQLPQEWLVLAEESAARGGATWHEPRSTYAEHIDDQSAQIVQDLAEETRATVRRLLADHPLFTRGLSS